MNILLIGDPHFKINNSVETDVFTNETIKYVEKEKENISFIVILGDVLHTHEKVHLQPLCRATEFIKKLAEIKYTFVLIGNHDRINNKVFLTEEHALVGLKNNQNIQIIDKVKKFKQFLFVPYVEPGRFQEALDTIEFDMSEIKAIFAHQEFYGTNMKSYTSEIGDKWSLENPPVFSGHIHGYQEPQPNIIYTGTPYQINFGESEDKSLLLLKMDKEGYKKERIYLQFIKKKTIRVKADELKNLDLGNNTEWRIIIEDDIKYIKNIISIPEIKEKIKNCHLIFNFEEKKDLIEDKSDFICPFDKILSKKIEKLDPLEREYFYQISSSES
jgi:hypothetical protein